MIRKFLLLLCLSLWVGVSHAVIVKYVINSQLSLLTSHDYYHQSDLYDLDGAYSTRVMIVDTSVPSDPYDGGSSTIWSNSPELLISNTYHITGRPGGAADLNINAPDPSRVHIQNAYSTDNNSHNDQLELGSARLTGVLKNFYASGDRIHFYGDYFPGTGYVAEPPHAFSDSDVSGITSNVFAYRSDDGTDVIDGKLLYYKHTPISAYASLVPIPATAWLFGSALIGFLGIAGLRKSYPSKK